MIEQAIEYGMKILGLEDEAIDISYHSDLGVCGEILCDDEDIEIFIDSRLSVKEMIITIFHELVHARQWLDGNVELPDEEAYRLEDVLYRNFLTIF